MSLLCSASKEVLEAVLLFMEQQYGHLSPASRRKLQPRASVHVFTEEEEESGDVTWFVRVEASDVGVYFLDGQIFLTKLCEHGDSLRSALSARGTERREVIVFSRRIGDYSTVQHHTALLSEDSSGGVVVEESVLPRPHDFPPSGLRVCFQTRCCLGTMKNEAHKLASHIHLLHLINPGVELGLSINTNSQVLLTSQFSRESGWHPLSTSPYSLISSIHNYTSVATKQTKLHLTRGTSYPLSPLTMKDGSLLNLKVYCSAAFVPHLSLRKGRKIPANRTCKHLHASKVNMFGPGSLPLLSAGSFSTLSSLADWDNYGVCLEQSVLNKASDVVESSWSCQLSDNQTASRPQDQLTRKSRGSYNRNLMLFVFLEKAGAAEEGVRHCTTHYWSQQMDCVHEVRGMLDGLIYSQRKKFKQATHCVLNKLLCNYGTHIKTASVMHTALPLLAEAVATIVKQSTNSHFKRQSRDILNVQEEEGVQENISEKLWKVAEKRLHISKTRTIFPQEPLSPELEQAAAENSATSTTNNDSSLQTATSEAVPSSSTLQTADDDPNRIAEVDSKMCSQPNNSQKYSLFQAMINSKRVKTTAPHQSPSTASLQPSSSEQENARESSSVLEHSVERSFDTLAELLVVEEPSDGNSGSFLNSALNSDDQKVLSFSAECLNNTSLSASTEKHTTCFEDLGDIDIEDSTCLESLIPDGQVNLEEGDTRPGDDDSVGSSTEMDWEETNEEFEDVFDDLSDFPTSSETSSECGDAVGQPEVELVLDMERECQAPDPMKPTINRALSPAVYCTQDSLQQNSLSFLNPIPNSVSMLVENTSLNKLPIPVTSTDAIGNTTVSELHPATDDDWVQLGELDVVETSTVQQAPVKSAVAEQLKPGIFDGNLRRTPPVPDLQCTFTTDIDEDDFHWD